MPELTTDSQTHEPLLRDLRHLIAATRLRAATAINLSLALLYWQMGRRIRRDVLEPLRSWLEAGVRATSGTDSEACGSGR